MMSKNPTYNVVEIFRSIQGEGPFSGYPAVFIRLGGCNLACPFCDTHHEQYTKMTSDAIRAEVQKLRMHRRDLLVVTGGEPFLQKLDAILIDAHMDGWHIQIETNGTIEPADTTKPLLAMAQADVIVSPKTAHIAPWYSVYARAFKYVVPGSVMIKDGWILNHYLDHLCFPPDGFPLENVFLQPEDGPDYIEAKEEMIRLCHLHGYRASLQIHKLLEVN